MNPIRLQLDFIEPYSKFIIRTLLPLKDMCGGFSYSKSTYGKFWRVTYSWNISSSINLLFLKEWIIVAADGRKCLCLLVWIFCYCLALIETEYFFFSQASAKYQDVSSDNAWKHKRETFVNVTHVFIAALYILEY